MTILPLLHQRLARVRLAVFDVDGTLTDGGVRYHEAGESLRFDVKDGQGLAFLRKELGIELAFITGRGCAALERRAQELGVRFLFQRAGPKDLVLAKIQAELSLTADATLAMGDDLPDLALRKRAGLFCAPADAVAEVLAVADLVTGARAGHGAVREIADALLRAQGAMEGLLRRMQE